MYFNGIPCFKVFLDEKYHFQCIENGNFSVRRVLFQLNFLILELNQLSNLNNYNYLSKKIVNKLKYILLQGTFCPKIITLNLLCTEYSRVNPLRSSNYYLRSSKLEHSIH